MIYFDAVPDSASKNSFTPSASKNPLCPFGVSPSFFEHLLVFWYKIFQVHSLISQSQFWNWSFLQGVLVLIGGWCLETTIWAQNVLIGTGISLLLAPLSEVGNVYIYIQTSPLHTYTHLYLFIYLSINQKPWVHTNTSNFNPIPLGSF